MFEKFKSILRFGKRKGKEDKIKKKTEEILGKYKIKEDKGPIDPKEVQENSDDNKKNKDNSKDIQKKLQQLLKGVEEGFKDMELNEKELEDYLRKLKETPLSELSKTLSKQEYELALKIHQSEDEDEEIRKIEGKIEREIKSGKREEEREEKEREARKDERIRNKKELKRYLRKLKETSLSELSEVLSEKDYSRALKIHQSEDQAEEIRRIEDEIKKELEDGRNRGGNGKEEGNKNKIDEVRPSKQEIQACAEDINRLRKEVSKAIVGQEAIVDGLIMGLLCNAHVLVEGVPGIAKTLAIRALACASGCSVQRIQFTVDMLPTDIIGITSYTPGKGFEVIKGPIFANFLIADEINRSPPKTQSALIEGMQERQVTIGREKYFLPSPFFVMATENPIENAGVYPLPEAQIDRFLFKLIMGYPKRKEESKIMEENMTLQNFEDFGLKPVITPERIVKLQEIVKRIYLDDNVKEYILSIVRKTRDREFQNTKFISYGSSPRASIGLFIASKARALMEGRDYVLPEDVKRVAFDVMRHRLILSYKATIQKITPDMILRDILNSVKVD